MHLYIFNSLSRRKERFTPLQAGQVSLYTCGVTVYDYCHIGHARTYVAFDVVVRFLRYLGYEVTWVRNITDVDDKIIQRAAASRESPEVLVARFTERMYEDFDALNIMRPDYEPRATESIPGIISFIQSLLDNEDAYCTTDGDVYFRVSRFKDYGKLSHQNLEGLMAGARVEVGDTKESPLDFALWKAAGSGELAWDSPWSRGRPGWHIECSAMARAYLGKTFDIHAGGTDLKFPHHENEIAQSECANQCTLAHYWLHAGMVQVDDQKMAKSLNNFFTIADVLAVYAPEVVRYFLCAGHYRSALNYSTENLEQAKGALVRFYTALRGITPGKAQPVDEVMRQAKHNFDQAMADDFNIPEALAALFALARQLNIAKNGGDMTRAAHYAGLLKKLGGVLGLLQDDPETFLHQTQSRSTDHELDDVEIEQLVEERRQARQNKQWPRADAIRDKLKEYGIILEDGKSGTSWRRG